MHNELVCEEKKTNFKLKFLFTMFEAMFQSSSKLDHEWPNKTGFCQIQDGGGGHLGCGAEPRFYHFSIEYVTVVLSFKFHQNRTING